MEEKTKSKNNKQKIILLAVILLLCLSGVGIFFLMNKGEEPVAEEEFVYDGKWDVSWYDKNEKEYVITTKEQLFGLADLSQENNFRGKTIKLGADIIINEGNAADWKDEAPELQWQPIGRDKMPFNGTFDGQGHTISGIYLNISDEQAGFFAATDDASQVLNFKIVNSYYKMRGDQGVGTFACRGAGFYSQLYSDAIIDCEGWNAGGIMGYKKNKGTAIISECWFDGSITLTGRMAGGISGKVYQGGCTIQHCLNTGNIYSTFPGPQAATIGGIVGNVSQLLTITDCFSSGLMYNEVGRPEVATIIGSVSQAGDITAGLNWSTKEGAASSVGTVHADATVSGTFFQLPETLLTGFEAYKRTDLNFEKYWAVVEDDTPMLQCFAESIPSVEGLERAMTADTSWYDVTKMEYVLTTPEQLKGFAVLSAGGQNFYGKTIKLGADITYNPGKAENYSKDVPLNMWIPINKFMGTFDGQGHTISGLYVGGATDHVGMFAFAEKQATIKNFKLTNSYFESTTTNGNYGTGSVLGAGGGTIERIYSDAIVVTSKQFGGGIVGLMNRDGSVSECWFDGEVMTAGRRSGGIVAGCYPYYVSGNPVKTTTKISHCLNTGYIHRTDKKATDSATSGGIVGVINKNNTTTVEDCFSAGLVTSPKYESGKNDELGAICSAIADGGTATIKNSWGTVQSYKKAVTTIKPTAVSNITMTQVLDEALIKGYGAVRLTTLNFSKYWAVDLNGTPILKCFAKNAPSIAGVVLPDTSWYNEKKTEFVINTVEQLYGFSVLANTGVDFEGKTVKLGKDLTVNSGDASTWKTSAPTNNWYPIKEFRGTFDGQGHTISGIYSVDTENENIGRGLFAKTEETSVIKNLKVVNSYFETKTEYALSAISSRGCGIFKNIYTDAILNNTGGGHTGGILGMQLWNDTTIENCWFDGQITDPGRRIGGILGYASKNKATIAHCLFTGSITRNCAKDETIAALAGGIVGSARGTMTISDCLSVGTLSSNRTKTDVLGSLIGETVKENDITLKNLYASSNTWTKAIGSNGSKSKTSTCYVMSDKYLTGENASLLTELDFKNYWAVIKDSTPELKTFAKGSVISNPKVADTSWYDGNENKIADAGDLYGFYKLSKTKNFEGEVIQLSANIEVNTGEAKDFKNAMSICWNPINNFAGEFNGNGYTISGLYGFAEEGNTTGIGLFGTTKKTANIHDVSLVNTYFESKTTSGMAGIAARGQGTFKNLHTDVILYNELEEVLNSKNKLEAAKAYMGGIVGIAIGDISIEDCWSESDISGAGRYAGGILGYANKQEVTIEHCLNSGTIYRFGSYVDKGFADYGGIIGSATADKVVTINDCLNTGVIKSDRTITGTHNGIGHIAGEGPNADNKFFVTNSYSVSDNCYNKGGNYTDLVGVYASKAEVSDCGVLSADKLKGVNAFQKTTLDFKDEEHWVLKGDGTNASEEFPVLKVFNPNEKDYLEGVVKYNTEWFDETANKGTLASAADLYGMQVLQAQGKFDKDTTITLGKDIVVNALSEGQSISDWADPDKAPLNAWTPIGKFEGTLDGKGYGIYGLYNNSPSASDIAFIKQVTATTKIKDITFDNCYFAGVSRVGIIAGKGGATFTNVHIGKNAMISATGNMIGGFIGNTEVATTISNCWFEGTIEAENTGSDTAKNVGGFLGQLTTASITYKIEHSLSAGTIKRINGKNANGGFGGFVGKANKGTLEINDCLHVGVVTSTKAKDEIGMIVGSCPNAATISSTNTYGATRTESMATKFVGAGTNAKAAWNDKGYEVTSADVTGTAIDTNKVKLDFTNYWLMVANAYPELLYFKVIQPDTTWFDETTNKGSVSTAAQLYGFSELAAAGKFDKNTVITLSNDIVVNELDDGQNVSDWADSDKAPLNKWTPIAKFEGTLDGKGYGIYGLYNSSPSANDIAIIKQVTATTKIKDITFDNCYFAGVSRVGIIAGKGGATFTNVHIGKNAMISATGNMIGGFIGNTEVATTISNCWFEGTIEATNPSGSDTAKNVGGFLGQLTTASITYKIEHSLSAGTIKRINGKNANGGIGGFVGKANKGTLEVNDSLHVGVITSTKANDEIGMIVGSCPNAATISNTNTYGATRTESMATKFVGAGTNAKAAWNDKGYEVALADVTGTAIDTDKIKLDFTNSWIMLEGKTPALKAFQ